MATLTRSMPDPGSARRLDTELGPDIDHIALRRAEDRETAQALGFAEPAHVAPAASRPGASKRQHRPVC